MRSIAIDGESRAASAQNVQPIVVNTGPANNYFNGAFTSVDVAFPARRRLPDDRRRARGHRIERLAPAVERAVALVAAADRCHRRAVAECAQFLDGFTWGPVQTADVKLAGEQASAVPIQVIGAPGFSTIPAALRRARATPENTLESLGANGILGIGLFRQDCGMACAVVGRRIPGSTTTCPSAGCQTRRSR